MRMVLAKELGYSSLFPFGNIKIEGIVAKQRLHRETSVTVRHNCSALGSHPRASDTSLASELESVPRHLFVNCG